MLYIWLYPILYIYSKFVSTDKKSDDNIVHLNRFGKTMVLRANRLMRAFKTRCLRSIFLRIALSRKMQ